MNPLEDAIVALRPIAPTLAVQDRATASGRSIRRGPWAATGSRHRSRSAATRSPSTNRSHELRLGVRVALPPARPRRERHDNTGATLNPSTAASSNLPRTHQRSACRSRHDRDPGSRVQRSARAENACRSREPLRPERGGAGLRENPGRHCLTPGPYHRVELPGRPVGRTVPREGQRTAAVGRRQPARIRAGEADRQQGDRDATGRSRLDVPPLQRRVPSGGDSGFSSTSRRSSKGGPSNGAALDCPFPWSGASHVPTSLRQTAC